MRRPPRRLPRLAPAICLVAALPWLAACGGGEPFGRVAAEPEMLRLGYPEAQKVQLTWQPLNPLPSDARPVVFLHLVDDRGEVLRTFDHPFPGDWRPEAEVSYDHWLFQSALAAPLPPGRYELTGGLYEAGGERWALESAAGRAGKREYLLTTVEVTPPNDRSPRFDFAGDWAPVELGNDRQVPARRWLRGDGSLEVNGLPGSGTLYLVLHVPTAEGAAAPLVLDEAPEAGQQVVVTSGCGEAVAAVTGPGMHEVELPLSAAADGSCRVEIHPNYHLLLGPDEEHLAVSVEVLAWHPDGAS
jgi:hypothetical protein